MRVEPLQEAQRVQFVAPEFHHRLLAWAAMMLPAINLFKLANPHLPFGGVNDSGYGREDGGFGLKEFVNVKLVMVTGS